MRIETLLLACLFSTFAAAQDELTVAQVQLQSDFIVAKQMALLGKTDEAISKFRELADRNPKDDAVQFELARLYKAKGDKSQAIDYLEKAYAGRSNEIYAAFLAELLRETGRHKEGAALFSNLRKKDPANEEFYLEEAAFLVRAQDIKGAVAVYDALEKRIGVNAELARLKHTLYLGAGDTRKAEKELLELVEAQPRVMANRHLLAGFYVAQQDQKSAERVYREILKIEPSDVRAQLALQNTDNPARAGKENDDQLMALFGRSDVDIDLKIGKLLPLVQQISSQAKEARPQVPGTVDRALKLAHELRRVHPDEAKASALLGDIYFQSGQLPKAADAYIATLELDDNVYPVWEQLLGTLFLANRTADLRNYAEDALDLYPNRPNIYVQYALGEALRANFGEANSLLDQARLMVSTNAKATTSLNEISRAFQVLSGSAAADAINLKLLPGGANGPLGFLMDNGKDLSALEAYDTPENTNSLFLEKLGDALLSAGNKEEAAAAFTRAKSAGSKSKELAQKLSKLGS